jgi:hypothetical protein
VASWLLDEGTGTTSADGTGNGHTMTLVSTTWATSGVTTAGSQTSYLQASAFTDLTNASTPFTIAMWVNPTTDSGVLAHYSTQSNGTGSCFPLLGFGSGGHLVAQVLGPGATTFTSVTTGKPATGAWTHVAMTFTPSGTLTLYVGGVSVASVASTTRQVPAADAGAGSYLTFGADGSSGGTCNSGGIGTGGFSGSLDDMEVYNVALTAAQIATLASSQP